MTSAVCPVHVPVLQIPLLEQGQPIVPVRQTFALHIDKLPGEVGWLQMFVPLQTLPIQHG
jgi:hypothetical protein